VPSTEGGTGGLHYGEPLAAAKKADIAKSMSSDMAGRLRSLSDWRTGAAGGPVPSLEMGCLNSYGMGATRAAGPWNTPSPPTAAAFSAHVPPPLNSGGIMNSHPPLERQLTINPTFDPRINKPRKSQQQLLCSAAMEYMHRNPPPPLGSMPPQQQPPSSNHHHHLRQQLPEHHQNVTRIASAPESIRLWGAAAAVNGGTSSGGAGSSLPVAIVEPLGMDLLAGVSGGSDRSPIQRSHNSTSDSQLNRSSPTAEVADPFSSDTWKYDSSTGISPILSASPVGSSGSINGGGSSVASGTNIWGPPPPPPAPAAAAGEGGALTPPQRESPPPSPLGPVGSSRPNRLQQDTTRQQLKYHLCALFPVDQVRLIPVLSGSGPIKSRGLQRDVVYLC
jgi:hypothetical protein